MRLLRHLFARSSRSVYPEDSLRRIADAVHAAEQRHTGEICFAVEGGMPFGEVVAGRTSRERAEAAFARLRVWNTEHNTGVLVYILTADHAIEIVADRGIAAKVGEDEWRAICALMQPDFAAGEYEKGSLAGVAAITEVLVRHFPSNGKRNLDELPDRPVLL